jgi:rod shape-determining protein MreC
MLSNRRFDRLTSLFVALLVVSFLVATFDVRADGTGAGEVLREGAQSLFTPLQKVADAVAKPVVGFVDGVSNLAGLREENDRLQGRIRELERRLQETASLQSELSALQQINDLEPPAELTAITAAIFASGPSDFDNVRFINKGRQDGVVVGQAVIDENGLVGRIDLVSDHGARVRLITDPNVSVGIRVPSTQETGWVTGRGEDRGTLRLEMFRSTEPVREGDTVVTDGSRFPAGIPVGIVLDTAVAEAGFSLVTEVAPTVSASRLDFVKVIIDWSPLDTELDEVTESEDELDLPPVEITEGAR